MFCCARPKRGFTANIGVWGEDRSGPVRCLKLRMDCSNFCLAVFCEIWALDFMQKGSPCLGLPWKLSIKKSTVQCIVERDPQHWMPWGGCGLPVNCTLPDGNIRKGRALWCRTRTQGTSRAMPNFQRLPPPGKARREGGKINR